MYKWYSTLTTDWKFISSLPPFYSSAFRFYFFLSFSLPLSFFFPRPCYRVPGCADRVRNRVLDSDSRDRSERLVCAYNTRNRGRKQSELPRVEASTCLARCERMENRDGGRERERAKREHLVLIPALDTRGQKGGKDEKGEGVRKSVQGEGRRRSKKVERSAFMPSGSKFAPSRRGNGRFLLHLALNLRI